MSQHLSNQIFGSYILIFTKEIHYFKDDTF